METKESIEEEGTETNTSWIVTVEPEVEIQESEPGFDIIHVDEDVKQQSSESEEECSYQAVQEYESVLVGKICEVCGNPFQAFELINPETNKDPQLTTCETCSYYITPHTVKIEHLNSTVDKFLCDKCPKAFTRKDRLQRHQVTHSDIRPYTCKMCDKSFKRNDKLFEHVKLAHRSRGMDEKCFDLVCDVCGDIDGVVTVSVGENVTASVNLCEVCNLSRQEKNQLNDNKLFQCDLCLRYFSRKDHASRHRLSHLDVKPYECYLCEKSFNRKDRLLRHMKTHPDAKPFSCKICFQAFSEREQLRIHQVTHPSSRNKPHKCELCQKAFRDKNKLQRHLTTHLNYRPYRCELCDKSFKMQETLLSHQQIHSNWKPFKCETCGMAFKMRDTYKRHLLVHLKTQTYTCNVCSKTFKRSDKLKLHHLVHVDLKPYVCEVCNSAFKHKDKYIRHRREVHGLSKEENTLEDLQFEHIIICDICGKNFSCEDDLSEHKMVHYR